jgi:hypothetical protein
MEIIGRCPTVHELELLPALASVSLRLAGMALLPLRFQGPGPLAVCWSANDSADSVV